MSDSNYKEEMVSMSISMLPSEIELLDKLSEIFKLNRSQIVRQGINLFYQNYLKKFSNVPDCGIFVDSSGAQVFVGILTDEGKQKVANGQWKLVKEL